MTVAGNVATKVLIAGLGDLGMAIARQLAQSGMHVSGVRRTPANDSGSCSGINVIAADVTRPSSLTQLQSLEPEFIIYCVSASAQTDDAYQAAYVSGLHNVLETQRNNTRLRHVFFVSSTRVYGQDTDTVLNEAMPALPADFGGKRLLEAEQLLAGLGCGNTVLRLSGIYGPGRLRMLNLARSPENWPKQNTWSNRIHRDDAAAFTVFLITQILAGKQVKSCYIVTDCKPVPQYEVLDWLATAMRTARPEPLAVSGGKRLGNQAMLETGFKLQYPDYQAGYRTLLSAYIP